MKKMGSETLSNLPKDTQLGEFELGLSDRATSNQSVLLSINISLSAWLPPQSLPLLQPQPFFLDYCINAYICSLASSKKTDFSRKHKRNREGKEGGRGYRVWKMQGGEVKVYKVATVCQRQVGAGGDEGPIWILRSSQCLWLMQGTRV